MAHGSALAATMPNRKNQHQQNPRNALLLTTITIIALITLSLFTDGEYTGQATAPLTFNDAPARPLFQPLKDIPIAPMPTEEAPNEPSKVYSFQDKTPAARRTISNREREFSCENIGEVACVRGDPNNQYDPDSFKVVCVKTDLAPGPYWGNLYVDKTSGAVSEGWNAIVSPFKYADEKCQMLSPAGKHCDGTESKCLLTYTSKELGTIYKMFFCGGGVFVREQGDYIDKSCTNPKK